MVFVPLQENFFLEYGTAYERIRTVSRNKGLRKRGDQISERKPHAFQKERIKNMISLQERLF